jgi:3-oxoacyl-[acyl-carrier protein] reductase
MSSGRFVKRLFRRDIVKRILRRCLNKALNSRFLLDRRSSPELQRAHEARMSGIAAAAKAGRLYGKVAIITGGASGIGRATAILFAREGAKVVVADLKRGAVEEIASNGGEALYVQTDLLNDADVAGMVSETMTAFGRIDVLVNNAGALVQGSVTDLSPVQWQRIIDLNLNSAYRCCHHAIPHMVNGGGGSVIMTSSIQGVCGIMDHAGYAAAKGGLIALTRQVARQYALSQVRANCVSPGIILTPIFDAMEEIDWMIKSVSDYTPLGFLGVPEDIAYLNLFLASDESSYITGINVVADGGITMRGT